MERTNCIRNLTALQHCHQKPTGRPIDATQRDDEHSTLQRHACAAELLQQKQVFLHPSMSMHGYHELTTISL